MESQGKDEAWRRSQIQDLTLTTVRLIRERSNSQIIHSEFISDSSVSEQRHGLCG